jgi:glycosyltransferase involved in cell wall biosynthesis
MRISAIMITGKDARRREFAQVAVRCFLEQTHENKELVIVNDSGLPLGCSDPRIREIMPPFSPRTTLGDLRNIGLQHSSGDLVIQWDDDDWHDPERMEIQASFWEPGTAVLLKQQIRYSTLTRAAFLSDWRHGIHGTILHERSDRLRYPRLRKGEDSVFLAPFRQRKLVDASPVLYIRFFHGANTWDARHIMGNHTGTADSGRSELSQDELELLNFVLKEYYSDVFHK